MSSILGRVPIFRKGGVSPPRLPGVRDALRIATTLTIGGLVAAAAACSTDNGDTRSRRDDAQSVSSQPSAQTCPVTLPNGEAPPGLEPDANNHGNGRLWTSLGAYGVVTAIPEEVRPDGSISLKSPWFVADGVEGEFSIHGRRLDARAAPLEVDLESGGAPGFTGRAFWAAGLVFPSEGCWEVTGTAGQESLSVVILLLKVCAVVSVDGERLPEPRVFTSDDCQLVEQSGG
ncbi:MAG: hypothetical protein ACRDNG_05805 [Gaiellaceae bacterium]